MSPGMGIILVYFTPTAVRKFQWEPLRGGVKYTGLAKFTIFDRNRRLSRKQYEIGRWLLWITNRKSQVTDRSVSVPMTLSDVERRDARGNFFSGDSP